jgi:hypothetical protein
MDNNFFQLDLRLKSNKNSIKSTNVILQIIEENIPYHDSLDIHFSKSLEWCQLFFNNAGYESLKTYGRNLITNNSIRNMLNIYDLGWMEILAQRQEDYFYNTAALVLTDLFEQVAMRAEMKPFDFEELKKSKKHLVSLKHQ